MKIIYKSSDIAEAHIISGMLAANGIESHVGGHYLQGGVGELLATDYATVIVEEEDVTRAMALIAEYDNSEPGPDENRKEIADYQTEEEVDADTTHFPLIPLAILITASAFLVLVLVLIIKYFGSGQNIFL